MREEMLKWMTRSLLLVAGLLLVAFAFNRIAFVNYYSIPLALIVLLVILRTKAPDEGREAETPLVVEGTQVPRVGS